ncbi:hypothetical protein J4227_07070 [Candidatus Woesearchaeota archaeon]|nr:hypothetical protein [Candidatus Woesearchaeota archaeon]
MGMAGLVFGIVIVGVLVACCFIYIRRKLLAYIAANAVIFVAIALLAFLVFRDLSDLQEKFPVEQKLFLPMHNDEYCGAFTARSLDESIVYLGEQELSALQGKITANGVGSLGSEYYKVILIKSDALAGTGSFVTEDIALTESEAFSILDSPSPISTYVELYLGKEFGQDYDAQLAGNIESEIHEIYPNGCAFKGAIFRAMFGSAMQSHGGIYLVTEYKKGNIQFYPETISFSLIRLIPTKIFIPLARSLVEDAGMEPIQ